MDSLLHKFSLQNLLRQFFCGVVFFVPLWLFTQASECKGSTCSIVDIVTWETGSFLLFVSLASIIGTIIYHLEKNLYSYPLQLAYEYYYKKRRLQCVCLIMLLILAPMICLALVGGGVAPKWMLMVAAGLYMLLAIILLRTGRSRIVAPTIDAWYYEEMARCPQSESWPQEPEEHKKLRAISRLSTWSDFIHCVQSCCFSWILGCCVVQFRFVHTNVPTPGDESLCSFLPVSVIGTVLLLLLEMLVDMHRYRFVKSLNLKTCNADSSPAVSKQVKPLNAKIENVQVFHFCDEPTLAASSLSSNGNDETQITKETIKLAPFFYEKAKDFIVVMHLFFQIVKMIKRK